MIIAVDGPAASGKGTLARRLARHFGYAHLDSGKLYRAVGQAVVSAGGDPADPAAAVRAAKALRPESLTDPALGSDTAAAAASTFPSTILLLVSARAASTALASSSLTLSRCSLSIFST